MFPKGKIMITNIPIICDTVFHFPKVSAAITTPSAAEIDLHPVIISSLNNISSTIQTDN